MASSTTPLAADTAGRVCFGIELNLAYVDVAIERGGRFSGTRAVLVEAGEAFAGPKGGRLAADDSLLPLAFNKPSC